MAKKIDINLYSYKNNKGLIVSNKSGKIFPAGYLNPEDLKKNPDFDKLLPTRKQYDKDIKMILYHMGYKNITVKSKKLVREAVIPSGCFGEEEAKKMIPGYYTFNKPTGIVEYRGSKYIYLKILDERKLSWNTVLRQLHIKKYNKPFFIQRYHISDTILRINVYGECLGYKDEFNSYSAYKYDRILAIPIKNYLNSIDIYNIREKINKLLHGNVVVSRIGGKARFPFSFDTHIVDAFTNKTMSLMDVYNAVFDHKEVDILDTVNKLNIIEEKPVIYRTHYKEYSTDEYIVHNKNQEENNDLFITEDEKTKQIRRINNVYYRINKKYIIKVEDSDKVAKDKLIKLVSSLLFYFKHSDNDEYKDFKIIRKDILKVISDLIFSNNIHNEENIKHFNKVFKRYTYYNIFNYCYNNSKDLSLKVDRHISNLNRLTTSENILIDILANAVADKTNIYSKETSKKQYIKFVNRFVKEVYGKIKYEISVHNKCFDHYKYHTYETFLTKHINGIFISDKEFKLIVDSLKDEDKEFNLNPPVWLKYTILNSLGLKIDKHYYKGIHGKTICFSYNESVQQFLYKFILLSLNNNINFINIYRKKNPQEFENLEIKIKLADKKDVKSKDPPPENRCILDF